MLQEITQQFNDWSKLKIHIHLSKNSRSFYFKERQVWWASIGQNIGREENGKHKNFERPVLIFKKFNSEIFLAIPLSSQIKIGDYRYVFERNGRKNTINLSQMRVLSAKRLLRQLGKLTEEDYNNIKQLFSKLV